MGYKIGTVREMRRFIGDDQAYIELTVGPPLSDQLVFDENTRAYPIGPLGNKAVVNFGAELLLGLKIPLIESFTPLALAQGAAFSDITAIVVTRLETEELNLAASGMFGPVNRARSLLGLYTAGNPQPLVRIRWLDRKRADAEFLSPPYGGVPNRHNLDPISPELIRLCMEERQSDERLHYYIQMLEATLGIPDLRFRIARLYSLLETMAAGLIGQWSTPGTSITRTAIRFMLGYFVEFDVPRFATPPDKIYEFDHIELAGRLRDKIFHGGGKLKLEDVTVPLRPALELLETAPNLIAHQLRKDCERAIALWAAEKNPSLLADRGQVFPVPKKPTSYNGRKLMKPLITGEMKKGTSIVSVYIQIEGSETAVARLLVEGNEMRIVVTDEGGG